MRTQRLAGLIALTMACTSGLACKPSGTAPSKTPTDSEKEAVDPAKASAEAKADFAKIASRYATAT